MRDEFIRQLTAEVETNPSILLITADLGFGVLTEFAANFPDNYLNVGVAEQNMTLVAAGAAMAGKKVFTYSIGNFPTLRCLEMIRNDVCYHDLDVTVVSIGGGFSYGQLGMSHHATEDLAIMRSFKGMTVLAPCGLHEVRAATRVLCRSRVGPAFLRIDKTSAGDTCASDPSFDIGRARTLRPGSDVTIATVGGVAREVLQAADSLNHAHGLEARVLSMHTVSSVDLDAISAACAETEALLIVEEHVSRGGLGGAIAEACLNGGLRPKRFRSLSADGFSSVVGSQQYLRSHFGLDADSIERAVVETLRMPEAPSR